MKNPVLDAVVRPASWALRVTSFTLSRTVGHRTLTHSLLGVVLFVALVSLVTPLSPDLFVALVTGYASHLVADALNTRGVPLLWPVGRPFRLLPGGVRSGGAVEFVVALGAAAVAGYCLYALHVGPAATVGVL